MEQVVKVTIEKAPEEIIVRNAVGIHHTFKVKDTISFTLIMSDH